MNEWASRQFFCYAIFRNRGDTYVGDGIPHEVDVVFRDAVLSKKAASIGKTAGLVVACSAETYVAEVMACCLI